MNQAQEPLIPSVGKDPLMQRLLMGVREIVTALRREGTFLTRSEMADPIFAVSDTKAHPLFSGVLNRVNLRYNTQLSLPLISPQNIGVPLRVAVTQGVGAGTVRPTGRGSDGRTAPRVNGAASYSIAALGLYTFMNDGVDWYAGGP